MNKFFNQSFLIDYRIDERIENFFNLNNINYIKTYKKDNLYEEIDGHPDIIACDLGNITIMEPETYERLSSELKTYNVLKGKKKIDCKYPMDIAYNVVVTDKYLIGNLNYIDDSIKQYAKNKELIFITVRQGYTRCSTIPLKNNIFITSDLNIYETLKSKNIKSYYIKTDNIILSDRYDGFLGGSCGVFEDEIIFFGDISTMSFYNEFKNIAEENDIKYTNIFNDKIRDYGSMICLHKLK